MFIVWLLLKIPRDDPRSGTYFLGIIKLRLLCMLEEKQSRSRCELLNYVLRTQGLSPKSTFSCVSNMRS